MDANKLQVKVALADDVPGNRMIIVRLLERLGHKVICAVSNGAELLCECSAQQVDLVVTDLDMPVMDGLAAAQELSEKGIPVVLISGHPDAEEIVLEHEPVVARVLKPVSLQSLQSAYRAGINWHAPPTEIGNCARLLMNCMRPSVR